MGVGDPPPQFRGSGDVAAAHASSVSFFQLLSLTVPVGLFLGWNWGGGTLLGGGVGVGASLTPSALASFLGKWDPGASLILPVSARLEGLRVSVLGSSFVAWNSVLDSLFSSV